MTELLTSAQMRAIEQAAIASGEVTGLELMERAGRGVVEAILDHWWTYRQRPHQAVILCGPGNNGGDGYVVARLLRALHWDVTVFALGDPERLPPDALTNYQRWAAMGTVEPLTEEAFYHHQGRRDDGYADLYIDALFGTGVTRPVTGEARAVLERLSGSGGDAYTPHIVAIDAPSGLCLDSGRLLGTEGGYAWGNNRFASLTVAFDSPKLGHVLADGPGLCGSLVIKDIGIRPWREMEAPKRGPKGMTGPQRKADASLVTNAPLVKDGRRGMATPRLPAKTNGWGHSHKFSYGHALVVAGGAGHTGAARLAARAALRTGAGLVTMAVGGPAMPEVAAQITAVMLQETSDARALTEILHDARMNALCIGPGLGLGLPQTSFVRAALDAQRATVLDADALTLIAGEDDLRAAVHSDCLLTPHMGEFARLFPDLHDRLTTPRRPAPTGETAADFAAAQTYALARDTQTGPAYSKVDAVREAAARIGCTVLLKGADTVIATPQGQVAVHAAAYDRAAPWLATAGSGDVLAGIATGLLAMGYTPFDAACTAAWLHTECARTIGPGLIAEDLPEQIPTVLKMTGKE